MGAAAVTSLRPAPLARSLQLPSAAPGGRRASRHTRRLSPPAASAGLPPPPPLPLPSSIATLASIVPEFPRLGGQPVRDWIGQAVDDLPGFNGDDLARLLLPDLVQLVGAVDGPTFALGAVLLVAFVYWEGGILLRQLRQRQQADRKQRELERRRQQGGSDDEELAAEGEQLRLEELEQEDDWRHHGQHPEWTQLDWARHERRRGLGWLALTTAGLIWLTGVVNGNPRPFQP